MTETNPDYVHGTDPVEQLRLTRLNELLNDRCLAELALERGARVLDLGCGLGQLSRGMARATGQRVVGIEASERQIAEGRRQAETARESELIEFRHGDAAAPPLTADEWGRFDVAHSRFVLEHVTDPLAVVRAMAHSVRVGGRVVIADDDHDIFRYWPEPAGLDTVWRAYIQTYVLAGQDPYVGRKLVSLLHEAGVQPVRNTLVWFASCSGEAAFPWLVENVARILDGARAATVATGQVDDHAVSAAIAALRAWGQRPDAALWYAMSWAEGVRRA